MNLSAKTRYACIATLELAVRYHEGQPVQIRKISESHGIPWRFLVQILLQLKNAGLITSTRGASGGYQLAKAPESITLGDVMDVVEGSGEAVADGVESPTAATRVLLDTWQEAADAMHAILHSTSLAELTERMQDSQEPMYFI